MKKTGELRVFIGRKRIKLDAARKEKILSIVHDDGALREKREKLEEIVKSMNAEYKKKLQPYTIPELDTIDALRDFVILYLYTYHKMSCMDISTHFNHVITNSSGTPLSRRTIHRIVAKYKLNRSNPIAVALKKNNSKSAPVGSSLKTSREAVYF